MSSKKIMTIFCKNKKKKKKKKKKKSRRTCSGASGTRQAKPKNRKQKARRNRERNRTEVHLPPSLSLPIPQPFFFFLFKNETAFVSFLVTQKHKLWGSFQRYSIGLEGKWSGSSESRSFLFFVDGDARAKERERRVFLSPFVCRPFCRS